MLAYLLGIRRNGMSSMIIRVLLVFLLSACLGNTQKWYEYEAHFPAVFEAKNLQSDKLEEYLTMGFLYVRAGLKWHRTEIISADSNAVLLGGVLETNKSRTELINLFHKATSPVRMYYLREIKKLEEQMNLWKPTPLTQKHSNETSCTNGGVWRMDERCECPPYYVGKLCETPSCRRNAILHEGTCVCPAGWLSSHCQLRSCAPAANDNLDFSKNSLHVVFELKSSMGLDLHELYQNIKQAADKCNIEDVNFLEGYVLTTFIKSNKYEYIRTVVLEDSESLHKRISGLVLSEGTEKQPILHALNQNIQTYPWQHSRSNVFIFADSNDTDVETVEHWQNKNTVQMQLLQALMVWRMKAFFTITNRLANETAAVLQWLAASTHGDYFDALKGHYEDNKIFELIPLIAGAETIAVSYDFPFVHQKTIQIPVDEDGGSYFFYTNGNVSLKLNGEKMQEMLQGSGHPIKLYNTNERQLNITGFAKGFRSYRAFIKTKKSAIITYTDLRDIDNGHLLALHNVPMFSTLRPIGFDRKPTNISYTAYSASGEVELGPNYGYWKESMKEDCTLTYQFDNVGWNCTPGPLIYAANFTYKHKTFTRLFPAYCAQLFHHKEYPPRCVNNGGWLNKEGHCDCAPGHKGDRCEYKQCPLEDELFTKATIKRQYQSVTFVVDGSISLMETSDIKLAITEFVDKFKASDLAHGNLVYTLIRATEEANVITSSRTPSKFLERTSFLSRNLPVNSQHVDIPAAVKKGLLMSWRPASEPEGLVFVIARESLIHEAADFFRNVSTEGTKVLVLTNADSESKQFLFPSEATFIRSKPKKFKEMLNWMYDLSITPNLVLSKPSEQCQFEAYIAYNTYDKEEDLSLIINNEIVEKGGPVLRARNSNDTYLERGLQMNKDPCHFEIWTDSTISVKFGFSPNYDDGYTIQSTPPYIDVNTTFYVTASIHGVMGLNRGASLTDVMIYGMHPNGSTTYETGTAFSPAYPHRCRAHFYSHLKLLLNDSTISHIRVQVLGYFGDTMLRFHRSQIFALRRVEDLVCVNGVREGGFCTCSTLWEGAHCELPICVNGATRSGKICYCSGGYFGDHCELPVVNPADPLPVEHW